MNYVEMRVADMSRITHLAHYGKLKMLSEEGVEITERDVVEALRKRVGVQFNVDYGTFFDGPTHSDITSYMSKLDNAILYYGGFEVIAHVINEFSATVLGNSIRLEFIWGENKEYELPVNYLKEAIRLALTNSKILYRFVGAEGYYRCRLEYDYNDKIAITGDMGVIDRKKYSDGIIYVEEKCEDIIQNVRDVYSNMETGLLYIGSQNGMDRYMDIGEDKMNAIRVLIEDEMRGALK